MHVNNSIFTQVAFKRNDCLNPQKNINTLVNSNNRTLFNLQKAITVALHLTDTSLQSLNINIFVAI